MVTTVMLYFFDLKFVEGVSVPTLGVRAVTDSLWRLCLLEAASSTRVWLH